MRCTEPVRNPLTIGTPHFLQAVEPELTLADALLVPEHGKTVPIELAAEVDGRVQVVT